MLLASYQPLVEDVGHRMKSKAFAELVERLGFVPYFCFPAERLEDMLVHSFFAAPNYPEKIIIFQTDNYRKLDVVQWNRIFHLEAKGETFDVSLALNDVAEPFCEYLVPEFENVLLEIGLHDALYLPLKIDYAHEDTRDMAEGMLAVAQGKAVSLLEHANLKSDTTSGLDILRMRFAKNVFEICILPFLYIFMVSGRWEDIGTSLNPGWIFSNSEPQRMLTRIYNPEEPLEYKTYAYFEKAFSTFQLNMHSSEHKPSKNGPCPCGSGKKYKRCCGAAKH